MIANKYPTNHRYDIDDLIQEGYIGLVTAAERYDTTLEHKALFTTYAFHWVKARIYKFATVLQQDELSLDTPIGDDITLGDTLADEFIEPCQSVWLQELQRDVRTALRTTLSLYDRNIIELIYGIDCPAHNREEVSRLLGVTSSNVRNIWSRSLYRIHKSKWKPILEEYM